MSDTLSSPQLLYVVVFGLMCSPIHRSISASDIAGLLLIASSPTALVILKVRPVLVIRKPVAGCIYDPTAMISDHWQNDALMGFEIPDRWVSACAEPVRGRQDAPRQFARRKVEVAVEQFEVNPSKLELVRFLNEHAEE